MDRDFRFLRQLGLLAAEAAGRRVLATTLAPAEPLCTLALWGAKGTVPLIRVAVETLLTLADRSKPGACW